MPVKTSSASRGAKGAVHASKKHSDRTSRETARKPQHCSLLRSPALPLHACLGRGKKSISSQATELNEAMARDPSTCPRKRNIATQHKRHYGINPIIKPNNTINLHANKCRINTILLLINHIITHKTIRAIPNPPFLCARQVSNSPFPQTHDHLQHHPITQPNLSNEIKNPYQTQPQHIGPQLRRTSH
jgi:hypothetical protein